jgi:P4 family phage/plasmid primase-like protien
MAVLHGVGKNGKSTLVALFQDLLGDYSGVTNPNTIMQQKYGDATAQYQLAELAGVRFVGISETKRGMELEESVVKQITGNDTISARSPYGKPFGYRPQFTLWLSTNHKPEIPDGSEAIWDRLKLIPFTQRIDGKRRTRICPRSCGRSSPACWRGPSLAASSGSRTGWARRQRLRPPRPSTARRRTCSSGSFPTCACSSRTRS